MGRYAWWRMNNTLQFDSALEAALGYGLLAAEAYTWLIVILGFIQTAWPLQQARPAVRTALELAHGGRLHPHLQRAPERGQAHGAGCHGAGLARGQAQGLHPG